MPNLDAVKRPWHFPGGHNAYPIVWIVNRGIAEAYGHELAPIGLLGRRLHVGLCVAVNTEIGAPIWLGNLGFVGVFLRHGIENPHRTRRLRKRASSARVINIEAGAR